MLYNKLKVCKNSVRKKYRNIRYNLSNEKRIEYNKKIFAKLIESDLYKDTNIIFSYVSIGDEVDTYEIINKSLKSGKKIAVPYCVPNSRKMNFYFIEDIFQLKRGAFGVPEPVPDINKIADGRNGIMLIPALSFDLKGYRMGYGKGYYDRYLENFLGIKIGLCYSSNISKCILHNRLDKRVDYIITDKFTKFIEK